MKPDKSDTDDDWEDCSWDGDNDDEEEDLEQTDDWEEVL